MNSLIESFQKDKIDDSCQTIIQNTNQISSFDEFTEVTKALRELDTNGLKLKNFKTIIIEKEPTQREKSLPMLKFPQLTVCYHFNYHKWISEKNISYSVLTVDREKKNIPLNQIKLVQKEIKKNAKQSIPQKEKSLSDLMTASRVLLLKSQLIIQKKNIPDSINHLSNTLKEGKKRKGSEKESSNSSKKSKDKK